jgi:hypothetical protein
VHKMETRFTVAATIAAPFILRVRLSPHPEVA